MKDITSRNALISRDSFNMEKRKDKKSWVEGCRNALISRDSFNIYFLNAISVKSTRKSQCPHKSGQFQRSYSSLRSDKPSLGSQCPHKSGQFQLEKTKLQLIESISESQCPHKSGQFQPLKTRGLGGCLVRQPSQCPHKSGQFQPFKEDGIMKDIMVSFVAMPS